MVKQDGLQRHAACPCVYPFGGHPPSPDPNPETSLPPLGAKRLRFRFQGRTGYVLFRDVHMGLDCFTRNGRRMLQRSTVLEGKCLIDSYNGNDKLSVDAFILRG